MGVIEYESTIIFWAEGILSSCDPDTGPLDYTASLRLDALPKMVCPCHLLKVTKGTTE